MEKNRRPEARASGKADSALLLRGRWAMSMLMVALVMVASCSGDGDQSGSPLDDDAASGDENAVGAESEAEVEGAFAFAVEFRTGELWAINPDTQSIGLINTLSSETQRLWATGDGLWLAAPTELFHFDTSGAQLGSMALEDVDNLVADDGEVWVSGGNRRRLPIYRSWKRQATPRLLPSQPKS